MISEENRPVNQPAQDGDFTIERYQELLSLAVSNYKVASYSDVRWGNRSILWRHDVDYSLDRALLLAQLESEGRVKATYFVNPHSDFYNLAEKGQVGIIDNILQINPKFKEFYDTGSKRDTALVKHSISSAYPIIGTNDPVGNITIDKHYQQIMYANVEYNKIKRLRDYRVMGAFAEVADALDEICDEALNQDEDGQFMQLEIDSDSLDDVQKTELEKEFKQFIKVYELPEKGWEYFRRMLVDGEVFFEHIIHQKHTNKGVLGVLQIPTEIMDPIYDNVQNLLIKGFILRKPIVDTKQGPSQLNTDNKEDNSNPTATVDSKKVELIPLDKNQVTYIHSNNSKRDNF